MNVLFGSRFIPPCLGGPASESFYTFIHSLFSVCVHTISGCTSNLLCCLAQNVHIFHSSFCYFNHSSPFQMTFHPSKSFPPSLLSNLTHGSTCTLCSAFTPSSFCISQLLFPRRYFCTTLFNLLIYYSPSIFYVKNSVCLALIPWSQRILGIVSHKHLILTYINNKSTATIKDVARWETTRCDWQSVCQTSVFSLILWCSLLLY